MPPGRRSSSSRSSRSRSSSRSSSSRSRSSSRSSSSRSRSSSSARRRSSSSHSSSYSNSYNNSYRSNSRSTSAYTVKRTRRNQPTGLPSHMKAKTVVLRCKNHDYMYVNESWTDEKTGVAYRKGYYDENGTYYDADAIAFKKPDGSYEAHYVCEYCGTELEANWKEGFYPACKNCCAEMNKTPVYIDEIVNIDNTDTAYSNADTSYNNSDSPVKESPAKKMLIRMLIIFMAPIIMMSVMSVVMRQMVWNSYMETEWVEETEPAQETEINLEIYGSDIYLDEISPNIYRICTGQDEYEKHITWDYGARSYYDYDSNCYLWYNTDVSPNLWHYWYDDISGDNYYGWMECEGDVWYIEVSDTEWEQYEGDTSKLWHIENSFDE